MSVRMQSRVTYTGQVVASLLYILFRRISSSSIGLSLSRPLMPSYVRSSSQLPEDVDSSSSSLTIGVFSGGRYVHIAQLSTNLFI